ncbi:MAG: SufE family protein [Candidatus Hydrogenedens sp.]|nr:SufE family protein [Candidatus Hydrogenedens sp.]
MANSIAEKQADITASFQAIDDWESRYRKIIQLGKALPDMPEERKTEDNKVKGCQSQVWLHAALENGRLVFQADSDAAIVRGLIALLLEVYSGQTPAEILAADQTFIDDIGLIEHLSQTRSNGLSAMIKQIKYYALAYDAVIKRSGA